MSKIHVMDTHLANMIAAGEVVERPSGIVKELVENALDAHATHIEIHVIEGGMQEIKVVDNGEGMDEEDLQKAFKRHSTSKIATASDLNQIRTLGFRGEALPSIASVSSVEAISHDGVQGNQILIDNGTTLVFQRAPRNKGTTITVSNLFSKVPARLKYIKNTRYEYSIIMDVVQKFSIANPHTSFVLYNDGKETFRTYGNGKTDDVFLQVFGSQVARDAKQFRGETYDFKISGVLVLPQHNRANRHSMWITLNNRMVRLPKIQNTISDAFSRYMPQGRYPIIVMNIEVDPQLVDVNVHPSKWEVRLSKESDLIQCVLSTLENTLNTTTVTSKVVPKDIVEQVNFKSQLVESLPRDVIKPHFVPQPTEAVYDRVEEPRREFDIYKETKSINTTDQDDRPNIPQEDESLRLEPLTVLSQMSGKYILAQGDKGLYIIDQHAAMERIRYEYYQEMLLHSDYPTQPLLVPILIEGRRNLVARFSDVYDIFQNLQISIEQFGEDDMVIREIPMWIKDTDVIGFVEEVLDIMESEKRIEPESLRRLSIATLACHSSVRFNEYLSQEEMTSLVGNLRKCKQPFHCPHGRPTIILMDHKHLEKEFSR